MGFSFPLSMPADGRPANDGTARNVPAAGGDGKSFRRADAAMRPDRRRALCLWRETDYETASAKP